MRFTTPNSFLSSSVTNNYNRSANNVFLKLKSTVFTRTYVTDDCDSPRAQSVLSCRLVFPVGLFRRRNDTKTNDRSVLIKQILIAYVALWHNSRLGKFIRWAASKCARCTRYYTIYYIPVSMVDNEELWKTPTRLPIP